MPGPVSRRQCSGAAHRSLGFDRGPSPRRRGDPDGLYDTMGSGSVDFVVSRHRFRRKDWSISYDPSDLMLLITNPFRSITILRQVAVFVWCCLVVVYNLFGICLYPLFVWYLFGHLWPFRAETVRTFGIYSQPELENRGWRTCLVTRLCRPADIGTTV